MFSFNLKNIRKIQNISQIDLAIKLNVSPKTVSHWELGYSEPSLQMLVKIKKVFNVSYEELLED